MKTFHVIISPRARHSLKEIVSYIKVESPRAAKHVRKTLINLIKTLKNSPEKFSTESLLDGKQKNYRSVAKWHYKIIYLVTEQEVNILDIIHTSRHPQTIEDVS